MLAHDDISLLRGKIDELDVQLIRLLSERFALCLAIGRRKLDRQIPVWQPGRVAEITERAAIAASAAGFSPDFARNIWTLIIEEASRLESAMLNAPQDSQTPD